MKEQIDNSYSKKNHVLAVSAAIATIVYLAFSTLELLNHAGFLSLAHAKIPLFVTEVYLLIVGAYALHNSSLKRKNQECWDRKGERFVYIFWSYFGAVFIFCFFTGTSISFDLFESVGGVSTIFGVSRYFNIRR